MSDDHARELERRFRQTGDPQDGAAWVHAVLRTTGMPTISLISQTISCQRALHSYADFHLEAAARPGTRVFAAHRLRDGLTAEVTPDDIVDYLRGGTTWLTPGAAAYTRVGAESIREAVDAETTRTLTASPVRSPLSGEAIRAVVMQALANGPMAIADLKSIAAQGTGEPENGVVLAVIDEMLSSGQIILTHDWKLGLRGKDAE